MKYYVIKTLTGEIIGYISSSDLFYFEPKYKHYIKTNPNNAQLVMYKQKFYHPTDFNQIPKELRKEKFEDVIIDFATEKEYYSQNK